MTARTRWIFGLLAVLATSLCATVPVAAGDGLLFAGTEQTPLVQLGWHQRWAKVAIDPNDGRYAVAWSTVINHNLKLRFYSASGMAQTGEKLVNETLNAGRQDEPMLAMDGAGNLFVCWSDRQGYDGWGMGVYGRVYGPDNEPLGPEFRISEAWQMSQWEPMPVALPGGGWVVAFNGDDDGEAFLRFLAVDGSPLTGDVTINTFHNNGQTEAAVAVSADGVVLAIYADFGGNVLAGSGTNLLARRFTTAGVPLDALEFVVNDSTLAFDQYEPRMAASRLPNGQGVFVITWEDWGHDGDGAGIFARWYGSDGVPLGPEFQVNTTTAGNQLLPEVAVDHVGNTVITWQDGSTADDRIMARCFDAAGVPLAGEIQVSGALTGADYERPQVAVDPQGEHWVFAYGGPGTTGDPNPANDRDVFMRRAPRPALAVQGPAAIGTTVDIAVDLPGGTGWFFLVGAALSDAVGLHLPDGRTLGLDLDPLFQQALLFPNNGLPFVGLQGVLGTPSQATASIVVPPNPNLIGLPILVGALTLDVGVPGLVNQLRHVTRTITVTLE